MTSGLPIVSALKRLRSLESRHGKPSPAPMAPLRATAAMSETTRRAHTATGALIAGHGS